MGAKGSGRFGAPRDANGRMMPGPPKAPKPAAPGELDADELAAQAGAAVTALDLSSLLNQREAQRILIAAVMNGADQRRCEAASRMIDRIRVAETASIAGERLREAEARQDRLEGELRASSRSGDVGASPLDIPEA